MKQKGAIEAEERQFAIQGSIDPGLSSLYT
jgi:hypothetical protein